MVDFFKLQKWINRKYNCFNYFYIHKFKKWKNIKSLKIIKCFESKICVSFSQFLSQLFTVIYAFLQCHNYAFSPNSIWQICLKSFYYFGHSPDLSRISESIYIFDTNLWFSRVTLHNTNLVKLISKIIKITVWQS